MTQKIITLVAAGAVALGGFTFLQAKENTVTARNIAIS